MTGSSKTKKTSCKQKTTKKYRERGSPPFSAMDCPGETRTGNDGKQYISSADKRNIYRWVKEEKGKSNVLPPNSKRRFQTIDNGGYPFAVYDYGDKIILFPQTFHEETNTYTIQHKKKRTIPYKKIMVGEKGSAILLELGPGKYMFIGDHVAELRTEKGESIKKFASPIGNSSVTYPYAIGEHNTYFISLGNTEYMPNDELKLSADLYEQYYKNKEKGKRAKTRTLIKRMF